MYLSTKIKVLLILFIFIDLALSFNQYYNSPIDGDITSIVLPTPKYKAVLSDPFGINAINTGLGHAEINRYFSIVTIYTYFRSVPFASQIFLSPIDSVYFSSALLKIITHLLILFMIGFYITGKINFKEEKFILAVALTTIFFQSGGYAVTMGIIDPTVSYTVIYTLSMALTLILFFPFLQKIRNHNEKILSLPLTCLLLLISLVVPFMGNQIPILVFALLLSLIIGIWVFKTNSEILRKILSSDKRYSAILILFFIVCIYSYALSLYNPERNLLSLNFQERYSKLPIGLFNILVGKPGLWILLLLISINSFTLRRLNADSFYFRSLKWCGLIILVYILLLPLDGFYDYRPNIIRRDNFLPVILVMIYFFVKSSVLLVINCYNTSIRSKMLASYFFLVILFFTISDSPSLRIDNCQRASLEMLSISRENIVPLSDQCKIASWYILTDAKDSHVNAHVFYFWKITQEPKYYYQY